MILSFVSSLTAMSCNLCAPFGSVEHLCPVFQMLSIMSAGLLSMKHMHSFIANSLHDTFIALLIEIFYSIRNSNYFCVVKPFCFCVIFFSKLCHLGEGWMSEIRFNCLRVRLDNHRESGRYSREFRLHTHRLYILCLIVSRTASIPSLSCQRIS